MGKSFTVTFAIAAGAGTGSSRLTLALASGESNRPLSAADFQVIGFTLLMATVSTVFLLPVGTALAWVLARCQWPGKSWVETLITLPLVLPPVATGLILLRLFGRRGWIGGFLENHLGIEIVFTWKAVVLALAVMSLPLLVRAARTAFEAVDPRLEGVAATLGAGPWRIFWRITLPLAARGIASGALLGFARALGEFGATILLAGNIPGRTQTLSLSIYQSVQLGQDDHAFTLACVSALIAWMAVALAGRAARSPGGRG